MHDATVKVLQDYAATLGDRELADLCAGFATILRGARSIADSVGLVEEQLSFHVRVRISPEKQALRNALVAELIVSSTIVGVVPECYSSDLFMCINSVLAKVINTRVPDTRQNAAKAYGPAVEALVVEWSKE